MEDYSRIDAQLPIDLPSAGIDRVYSQRTVLKKAIGKPAG